MSEIIQGFQTEDGIAKYDYNALENKTHGVEELRTIIIPETPAGDFLMPDEDIAMLQGIAHDFYIGESLVLKIDEEEFSTQVKMITEMGVNFFCFGNIPILDGTGDTGDPYIGLYIPREYAGLFDGFYGIMFMIVKEVNFEDTTLVSLYGPEKVQKLDSKFLDLDIHKFVEPTLVADFFTNSNYNVLTDYLFDPFVLVPGVKCIVYLDDVEHECIVNLPTFMLPSKPLALVSLGMFSVLVFDETPNQSVHVKIYTTCSYYMPQEYLKQNYYVPQGKLAIGDLQSQYSLMSNMGVYQRSPESSSEWEKVLYSEVDGMDAMFGRVWTAGRDKLKLYADHKPVRKVGLIPDSETSEYVVPALEKTIQPGQIIKAKTVDSNFESPVEWEAVDPWIIQSSTQGSTKKFKISVDDAGIITAIPVT